jgi:predicted nucleic acid-binding protein
MCRAVELGISADGAKFSSTRERLTSLDFKGNDGHRGPQFLDDRQRCPPLDGESTDIAGFPGAVWEKVTARNGCLPQAVVWRKPLPLPAIPFSSHMDYSTCGVRVDGVVIDTNVFVAAGFNARSASACILAAVRDGRFQLIWNKPTRRETETILRRIPRLDWERVADLFQPENEFTGPVDPDTFVMIVDPDDRKFAALSAAAKTPLVTNDNHLLAHPNMGIDVLTPAPFWHDRERIPHDTRPIGNLGTEVGACVYRFGSQRMKDRPTLTIRDVTIRKGSEVVALDHDVARQPTGPRLGISVRDLTECRKRLFYRVSVVENLGGDYLPHSDRNSDSTPVALLSLAGPAQ